MDIDELYERSKLDNAFIAGSEIRHAIGILQRANAQLTAERDALVEANKVLAAIGQHISTQDNRCTDQPIFVVEKSVMVITDPDYGYDAEEWINTDSGDYEEATETQARRLDALRDGYRETGPWKKYFLKETWEFVTACFTEQGCRDYLEINGHNVGKSRIYAYGSYRNNEYRSLRQFMVNAAANIDKGESNG